VVFSRRDLCESAVAVKRAHNKSTAVLVPVALIFVRPKPLSRLTVLNARRCISYLTIELKGSMPVELRPLIGNRIYGCDDCQLVCPWNSFAQTSVEPDFAVRHGLDDVSLVELFAWDEASSTQNWRQRDLSYRA